ncbi:MAG: ATP-binding protein [Pseudomonadota bacterium]
MGRRHLMSTIHLIVGNVGSGKSTHAARLSAERDAHVFANDEWMRVLFFPDMPDPAPYEWALERTQRIEQVIVTEAVRLADRGMEVILDLGFFSAAQRARVSDRVREAGHAPQLHILDVDFETRWQRVEERNRGGTDSYQFPVSREVFEFCETIYETPEAEERAGAIVVT